MGAGGDVSPLKASDVFILIGASILAASFILTTWDSNVPLNYMEDSNEWYAEGSINPSGSDIIAISYSPDNDSSVEFLVYDSDGEEICSEMADLNSGELFDSECELTRGEPVTWSLDSNSDGELDFDHKKKGFSLVIMVAIFITGGVSLLYGLSIKTIIPSKEFDALNDDEDVNMVVEAELVD